jgi:hypothetical protein
VPWAFTTDGLEVVASEFSAQRILDPKTMKIDGSTLTLGRNQLDP